MAENAAARVVNRGKTLRNFNRFARTELRQGGRVPLRTRLWALRRGFLSTSVGLYDLTEESCSQYVSDWSRYIKSARINGRFASALNNKIVFSRMLQGYGCDVPEYYCLIRDGVMHQIGSRYRMRTPDDVLAACRAGGRFIVKPSSGSGGISVSALCSEDDGLTVNGEACADEILIEFLADLDEGIIEEYIQQHDYAERIFPHSANSIRVLTMWDVDRREPFIACAVHRFGTRTSMPVDNASQGGVFCAVDLSTGELGPLHSLRPSGGPKQLDAHPDTGEKVAGLRLPHWDLVASRIPELCRQMAYIPYIGWDVLITPAGFSVFEGNSYPELGHQVLEPLLDDPRVRAFYERYGVI